MGRGRCAEMTIYIPVLWGMIRILPAEWVRLAVDCTRLVPVRVGMSGKTGFVRKFLVRLDIS